MEGIEVKNNNHSGSRYEIAARMNHFYYHGQNNNTNKYSQVAE